MSDKIIEFTYKPITQKKRAYPIFFTILIISGVLVLLSVQMTVAKGLISLFAVFGLTIDMFVFIRYVLAEFAYSVTCGQDGDAVLVVTRTTGRRVSTMCCIRMAELSSVEKLTKEQKKQHAPDPKALKYNFAPSMSPEVVYLIKTASRTTKCEIIIEGTDELAARLLEYSSYAKEDEAANEDAY